MTPQDVFQKITAAQYTDPQTLESDLRLALTEKNSVEHFFDYLEHASDLSSYQPELYSLIYCFAIEADIMCVAGCNYTPQQINAFCIALDQLLPDFKYEEPWGISANSVCGLVRALFLFNAHEGDEYSVKSYQTLVAAGVLTDDEALRENLATANAV